MRLPNVAKGDASQDGGRRGGVREGATVQLPNKRLCGARRGNGGACPQDDVTAPELVITGGNGGVKGVAQGSCLCGCTAYTSCEETPSSLSRHKGFFSEKQSLMAEE